MQPARVWEHRALLALDALRSGAPLPPQVAVFRRLPTPAVGARLLAAQGNAARSRPLLWLVGADARGGVTGVDPKQVRTWLEEVRDRLEAPAPDGDLVPLALDGRNAVVLGFQTARAPFVVRPRGSRPGEVPWFDPRTNSVRSATRLDLVRLVTPLGELPQFEVLEAELTFFRNAQPRSRTTFRWTLDASLYVLPRGQDRLILPLHRMRAGLSIGDWSARAAEIHLTADRQSPAVRVTESAVLADGLGRFFFYCVGSTEREELPWDAPARFTADFLPAGAELAALAESELPRDVTLEPNQVARWKSA